MTRRIIMAMLAAGIAVAQPASGQTATAPTGFILEKDGLWLHEASGIEFPARAGGFVRDFETTLDENGRTVVISYRKTLKGEPVIARIALFQLIGLTPAQHFAALRSMVGSYFRDVTFSDVTLAGEGPFDPPRLAPGSGYQGRFHGRLGDIPYELSLSTIRYGSWDARLTAAYPASQSAYARKRILELVEDIRLPKRPKR